MKPRRPHTQIHLPPLTGAQAYLLVGILDRAVAAIWRAHGDDMADFQGAEYPDLQPPDDAVIWSDRPDASDDDIDF